MGASFSTQSNKSIEEIFAAETRFFNKAGTEDIGELITNIGEFADMHKRRLETFRKLKMKFLSDTGGKVIELRENEDVVDHLKNSMASKSPEMNEDIDTLYAMHAIYAERTNNDKMLERKINVFPDFEEGYELFYNKLTLLRKYKKIEVALDQNLISNDTGSVISSVSNAREKAIVTINKFLARNIFLTYAVIYNDYLSLIYTMYATKQMRLLNDVYVKSKKQLEFDMITKRLDSKIAEGSEQLKNSVGERDDRIKELVKNLDTRTSSYKDRVNQLGMVSGGNQETVNLMNQLVLEYEQNLQEYTDSNTILKTYFETVNNIVFDGMDKLAQFYMNLSNNNNVINQNLRLAIKETTEQIRSMSDMTDKEADKRIMQMTNQFSADMSEEEKALYFEIIGGPKGKTLKNLYTLQKDFKDNVQLTNSTLERESMQHSTPLSSNSNTPYDSPTNMNRINFNDNPLFEDKTPMGYVRPSSPNSPPVPSPSSDVTDISGGKKPRKYKR